MKYDKTDPKSIENYAKTLIGHTFREVQGWDTSSINKPAEYTYDNKSRKGGLGNFIEEQFFGYEANSDSSADFNEAGVELKVTPYEKKKGGKLSAGERLVLSMISYKDPVEPDFKTSHLWEKCENILLIYYLRDKSLESNMDYSIDFVKLFTPPEEDLDIIMQDYNVIINKIASGRAHELSESDTMYLGACTKGANAEKSTVPQEYYAPEIRARKRAFCYKNSYMTYVLNTYIASDREEHEAIIKDKNELKNRSFEDIISDRINKYIGKTDRELCDIFGLEFTGNKAQWTTLAYKMLGISSNKAEEFAKAQIVVKTISLEENGVLRENSPLPTFSFMELIEEEWEESNLFRYFDETKLFFVVFQKQGGSRYLKGCQLWNMPVEDLSGAVHEGWVAVRTVLKEGVVLEKKQKANGIEIKNNLLKKSENPIIHVRPHTQQTYYVFEDGEVFGKGKLSDSDELPDGRRMTKQSFWLNSDYIVSQLKDELK